MLFRHFYNIHHLILDFMSILLFPTLSVLTLHVLALLCRTLQPRAGCGLPQKTVPFHPKYLPLLNQELIQIFGYAAAGVPPCILFCFRLTSVLELHFKTLRTYRIDMSSNCINAISIRKQQLVRFN